MKNKYYEYEFIGYNSASLNKGISSLPYPETEVEEIEAFLHHIKKIKNPTVYYIKEIEIKKFNELKLNNLYMQGPFHDKK